MTFSPVAVKPHAVCIPYPAQGHINSALKLAKLLHSKGFHITYISTEYNYKRLLKSRGPDALDGLPDFRFETIPNGLPASDLEVTQDLVALSQSISKNFLAAVRDILAELNSAQSCPPVTCMITDGCMSYPVDAAEEFGIPVVLFRPASPCCFLIVMHFQDLVDRGITPLKDESYLTNGYLDTIIDWIPGMKNIPLRYLPSFVRTTDKDDLMLNYMIEQSKIAPRASAIVFNSFHEFEQSIIPIPACWCIFSIRHIGPLEQLPRFEPKGTSSPYHDN